MKEEVKSKSKDVKRKTNIFKEIHTQRWLYIFALPGFLFFLIFSYIPMIGIIMAFQHFDPVMGFFKSTFVGFDNFKIIFHLPNFLAALKNTIIISSLKLAITFPAGIIFALMLNEVRNKFFKKSIQTVTYLPYFISWVIAAGIWYQFLALNNGVLNDFLRATGLTKTGIFFLGKTKYFYPIVVSTELWKNLGFNSIIYLAALTAIDPELYEVAEIDGAGRFKKMWHISLPGIKNMIVLTLILSASSLINAGFDQIYNLSNVTLQSVSQILDTLVYGILRSGDIYGYSIGASMGLFQSVVGLLLFLVSNFIAKLLDEEAVI